LINSKLYIMKNKNFKDLVEDYFKLGLISHMSQNKLNLKYDNEDDSIKAKMDEYSQVVLDDYLSKAKKDTVHLKALDSIKNNVQFFAWLIIISMIISAVVSFVFVSET